MGAPSRRAAALRPSRPDTSEPPRLTIPSGETSRSQSVSASVPSGKRSDQPSTGRPRRRVPPERGPGRTTPEDKFRRRLLLSPKEVCPCTPVPLPMLASLPLFRTPRNPQPDPGSIETFSPPIALLGRVFLGEIFSTADLLVSESFKNPDPAFPASPNSVEARATPAGGGVRGIEVLRRAVGGVRDADDRSSSAEAGAAEEGAGGEGTTVSHCATIMATTSPTVMDLRLRGVRCPAGRYSLS